MSNKVNGSRLKLYVVELVSNVSTDKLISEQLGLTLSRSTNTIDITSKDNDGYEEFIGGLKSGEVSLDFIMDLSVTGAADKVGPSDISAIEASRAVKTYKAKLDDGQKTLTVVFKALVTKFDTSAPMEDKITCSLTLKRSGAPTETTTTNV